LLEAVAMSPCRSFAIVPAAGRSLRMGRAKLLLPWRESTVIQHVLASWTRSQVWRTVVIVRPDDFHLATVCRDAGVDVVTPPVAPPEMRVSIEHGLRHVEKTYRPAASDVWLLAPADIPELSTLTIDLLLASHGEADADILVPTQDGRRGHPVLFPWALTREVYRLVDEGVNALLRRHAVREIRCAQAGVDGDLDTPADYRRLQDGSTPP
jgi:molybdenum cofactor cytidylyltransferase